MEYVVVGVGINVNQVRFPGEIESTATSLRLETGREFDRVQLFREILRSMEKTYRTSSSSGFRSVIPQWLASCRMVNRTISVSQQGMIFSGTVKGLSPEGGLVLQTDGSERTIFAGDVTIVGH
jgi:BirA family biotin operon repressor/biotin-[acetyl-CoA-carboxylase] ligase